MFLPAPSTLPDPSRPAREVRRWIRIGLVGATAAGIAVVGSLVLTSRQESSAAPNTATAVSVAAVLLDVGAESSPASTGHDHRPGMDMSKMDMPESAPSPTRSGDMPGMDHSDMPGMDHGDMPGMDHGDSPGTTDDHGSGDMPGMDMPGTSTEGGSAAKPDRPLAPVLGTFGGGTAAVLLTAGMLRRKDRERLQAKQATRAAGRSTK